MNDIKDWMITSSVRNMTYGSFATNKQIDEIISWLNENWSKLNNRVQAAVLYDIRMHQEKDERFSNFVNNH